MMRKTKSTLKQCAALVSLLFLSAVSAFVFSIGTDEEISKELCVTTASIIREVEEIDVSSAAWDYAGRFVYDGCEHAVALKNVPEGIGVTYKNNAFTSAGNYLAEYEFLYDKTKIRLTGIAPSALEWSIAPAFVSSPAEDIANAEIALGEQWRAPQSAISDIPGMSVSHTDIPSAVGEYSVIASFEMGSNYIPISDIARRVTVTPRYSESAPKQVVDNTEYYIAEGLGIVLFVLNSAIAAFLVILSVNLIFGIQGERQKEKPRDERVYVRYKTSFAARLIRAPEEVQLRYGEIKNRLLSYSSVKSKGYWGHESYTKGKLMLAKIDIKGKTVYLYLALDPSSYSASKYGCINVKENSKYDKTPLLMKIRSDRAKRYSLELVDILMRELNIERGEERAVDYRQPYETNAELYRRGIVKLSVSGKATKRGSRVSEADVGAFIKGESRARKKRADLYELELID